MMSCGCGDVAFEDVADRSRGVGMCLASVGGEVDVSETIGQMNERTTATVCRLQTIGGQVVDRDSRWNGGERSEFT